ncbi:hypothetical protein IPV08_14290 [Methylobacterium sp. SD274]|uniref:hypothetical protein n=1 Tax=Methylobacterium sp. SD274 TaxID=2782009 RepID=UPI001A958A64|nr:hypothetical protein [Methylobacterium sp. SD274]MBO1021139.1 hypothetical protein [Methylobacterium sp. SD274]
MTLNITTSTPTAVPPGLILFGRDERHRPHASRFAAGDKAEAERAAGLMGMHVLEISNDTHHSLAAGLPHGRLFESGKAFVPFVKAEVFDRLVAAAGLPDITVPISASGKGASAPPASGGGASGAAGAGGPGGRFKAPTDWPEIERGCLVLACAGPQEGWFEAIIMYTKADDAFELQWRDWPDDPLITRHRSELGLLPPGAVQGAKQGA